MAQVPGEQLMAAGKILYEYLDGHACLSGTVSGFKWEDLPLGTRQFFANAVDASLVALPYE